MSQTNIEKRYVKEYNNMNICATNWKTAYYIIKIIYKKIIKNIYDKK